MIQVTGYIEVRESKEPHDLVERLGLKGPIMLKAEPDQLDIQIPELKPGQFAIVKIKTQVMMQLGQQKLILPGGPI